jgi:hypothetical protein
MGDEDNTDEQWAASHRMFSMSKRSTPSSVAQQHVNLGSRNSKTLDYTEEILQRDSRDRKNALKYGNGPNCAEVVCWDSWAPSRCTKACKRVETPRTTPPSFMRSSAAPDSGAEWAGCNREDHHASSVSLSGSGEGYRAMEKGHISPDGIQLLEVSCTLKRS